MGEYQQMESGNVEEHGGALGHKRGSCREDQKGKSVWHWKRTSLRQSYPTAACRGGGKWFQTHSLTSSVMVVLGCWPPFPGCGVHHTLLFSQA